MLSPNSKQRSIRQNFENIFVSRLSGHVNITTFFIQFNFNLNQINHLIYSFDFYLILNLMWISAKFTNDLSAPKLKMKIHYLSLMSWFLSNSWKNCTSTGDVLSRCQAKRSNYPWSWEAVGDNHNCPVFPSCTETGFYRCRCTEFWRNH